MFNKKTILGIFFCFVLLSSCIFVNLTKADESATSYNNDNNADWTVMYYVCADFPYFDVDAEKIIENVTKIGSTNNFNLLVLKDSNGIGDAELFYVTEMGEKEILNDKYGWPNEVNTGDINTFEQFCKQMMDAYPAKYYGLVVVAFGGTGWQLRPLADKHPRAGGPSMPAFRESLRQITNNGNKKIDVLNMNSCVLGMVENAYEISPYVNYLVASEDHVPDGSHCIKLFYEATWDLKNNTMMSPEEYANRTPFNHKPVNFTLDAFTTFIGKESIITKILNKLPFQELHTIKMSSTASSTNLSKIRNLTKAVDDLASTLLLNLNDKGVKNVIKEVRKNVREYGKARSKLYLGGRAFLYGKFPLEIFAFDCYIDLYNFVELLSKNVNKIAIKNLCFRVMEKLNDSITANTVVPGDESHGLSIYFPSKKIMYNKYEGVGIKPPSPYEELQLSKDTRWDEFIKEYLHI